MTAVPILYYSNVPHPDFPEVEVHPRLTAFYGAKRSVIVGINNLDAHIAADVKEAAQSVEWLLCDAVKKRRSKRLWHCLQYTLFFAVVAVVVCAANGIWEPFWYVTLPITAPLFLLYVLFDSGLSSLNAMPRMDIVVLLLMLILFNMQWRK